MGAQMSKEEPDLHFGYRIVQDKFDEGIKEKEIAGGHSVALSPSALSPSGIDHPDLVSTRSQPPLEMLDAAVALSPLRRGMREEGVMSQPVFEAVWPPADGRILSAAANTSNDGDQALTGQNEMMRPTGLEDEDEDNEDEARLSTSRLEQIEAGITAITAMIMMDDVNEHADAVMSDASDEELETDNNDDNPEHELERLLASVTNAGSAGAAGGQSPLRTTRHGLVMGRPSGSSAMTVSTHSVQLEALKFGELPRNCTSIGMCGKSLRKLSPNIGLLQNIVCLQLCCNQLRSLPAEIGYLSKLRSLDLSGNQLRRLPETIGHLSELTVLRLSRNRLQELPRSLRHLHRLERLSLDRNRLTEIPSEIGQLKRLTCIDVRWNTELYALPAEVARLAMLRRLRATGCPLQRRRISHRERAMNDALTFTPIILVGGETVPPLDESANNAARQATNGATSSQASEPTPYTLPKDPVGPPSLRELAARTIIRHQIPIPVTLPTVLKRYLASAGQCSECGGPYFEHIFWRHRLFTKQYRELWLEHRLCSNHWTNEHGRIASLFGELPSTAPVVEPPASVTTMRTKTRISVRNRMPVIERQRVLTSTAQPDMRGDVQTGMHTMTMPHRRSNTMSTIRSLTRRTFGRRTSAPCVQENSKRPSVHDIFSLDSPKSNEPETVALFPVSLLFETPALPELRPVRDEHNTPDYSTKYYRNSLAGTDLAGSTAAMSMASGTLTKAKTSISMNETVNGPANAMRGARALADAAALASSGLLATSRRMRASTRAPMRSSTLSGTGNGTSEANVNAGNASMNMLASSAGAITLGNEFSALNDSPAMSPDSHMSNLDRLPTCGSARGTSSFSHAIISHNTQGEHDAIYDATDANSILSAGNDIDPNDPLTLSTDRIDVISSYSGMDNSAVASPSASSPGGRSEDATPIGRKSTLVGSLRRRFGAGSRPSARSLRRAFVAGQAP
jgi:Leucine-rich repeat (LRR) protein